ncbi:hypothetical protein WDW37_18210 [Bdellovibrionota bacterium FG-1]
MDDAMKEKQKQVGFGVVLFAVICSLVFSHLADILLTIATFIFFAVNYAAIKSRLYLSTGVFSLIFQACVLLFYPYNHAALYVSAYSLLSLLMILIGYAFHHKSVSETRVAVVATLFLLWSIPFAGKFIGNQYIEKANLRVDAAITKFRVWQQPVRKPASNKGENKKRPQSKRQIATVSSERPQLPVEVALALGFPFIVLLLSGIIESTREQKNDSSRSPASVLGQSLC